MIPFWPPNGLGVRGLIDYTIQCSQISDQHELPSGPFITKKIADEYMIQRSLEHGYWLTPEGTWNPSIFEGAGFKKRRDAQLVLDHIKKHGLEGLAK